MYILKLIYQECPYFFLDNSCNIGVGLFIQHGFSTIIMADLGDNCWVNQQVTIGHKDKTGRPKIGNNVRITAGAKVLGNITIGDRVTIGANAVVVKNVPADCVVVGVPAYIIRRNGVKGKESL
jgi:serine O-acetyltransferase